MQKGCVVVPCYNEAERLEPEAFVSFIATQPAVDFLFCDDGSTDQTLRVLEKLRARFPQQIHVHSMPANAGKAEAVRTGLLVAAEKVNYSWFGYWDADLATPLDEIPRLAVHLAQGKKMAMASRVKRLGANVDRNEKRHYLGRIFSTFSSITLGLPVYDSQCGAKLFSVELKGLLSQPFMTRWLFDVELLARYRNHYGRQKALDDIIEVPVHTWSEKPGSKLRFGYMLKVPFELWKIGRRYRTRKH